MQELLLKLSNLKKSTNPIEILETISLQTKLFELLLVNTNEREKENHRDVLVNIIHWNEEKVIELLNNEMFDSERERYLKEYNIINKLKTIGIQFNLLR